MGQLIAITGTKGKTSLVRILEHVLRGLNENVLRVDTTGAYYNGQIHFSDDDSRNIWGYAATNAPGRFLALHGKRDGVSLLECTLFSARTGLAYKSHDIGVFTNVFEDHIGSFSDIQSKKDIAEMKSFVFSHIKQRGTAVYNADDDFVCSQLAKVPNSVTRLAVSLRSETAAPKGGYIVKPVGQQIKLIGENGEVLHAVSLSKLNWLAPAHTPSLYLALFAIATLFATESERLDVALELLQKYEFSPDGGRLVKVELKKGVTVLLDYAHEKVSLQEIAKYGHSLCDPGKKVIGVLRLAPSRTEELVKDTAQAIYDSFDEYVIYDKIDGYYRMPKHVKGYKTKMEETGKMSKSFAGALQKQGTKLVHEIIREDQALQKAVDISYKGDVIIYIVGDDSTRSRQFVSKFQ